MWTVSPHSTLSLFRASHKDFTGFYSGFLILVVHWKREFESCMLLTIAHVLPEIPWLFMKSIFNKAGYSLAWNAAFNLFPGVGEPGFSQVSWDRMHSGVRCRGSMYSRSLWSIYRTQCCMELGKIPGADCWWGWEQRSGFCTWLYLKCIFKCRYLVGLMFWPGRWQ